MLKKIFLITFYGQKMPLYAGQLKIGQKRAKLCGRFHFRSFTRLDLDFVRNSKQGENRGVRKKTQNNFLSSFQFSLFQEIGYLTHIRPSLNCQVRDAVPLPSSDMTGLAAPWVSPLRAIFISASTLHLYTLRNIFNLCYFQNY